MTKQKKIRFLEYYDLQSKFDELFQLSKNNNCFQNLMNLITSEENIKLAYRSIKKNKGSKTKGTDGLTIQHIESMTEKQYIRLVRNKLKRYTPKTVKRTEIPKQGSDKTRPLGIPCIVDRLVGQCIYQALEPICEAKFHERSNGFRPNRSCEHAIAQSVYMINFSKLYFVVDIDIKGFFDNVNHNKLIKQMWTLGIQDKSLLSVIRRMLKAKIQMPNGEIVCPNKGTPQGGILSPLLSNIVLNELDWWIASQWERMPTEYNYIQSSARYKALKRGKLKEMFIVRYADDFKIFCRKRSDANKAFEAVKQWLKERLSLDINLEKSKVINLRKHSSEFLGFELRAISKGKKIVAKTNMSKKSIKKVTEKLINGIKEIQRSDSKDMQNKINLFNSAVIGIHNYYQIATQVNIDCNGINERIGKVIKNRLDTSKKGKISNLHIKKSYGRSRMIRYLDGRPILPIGYIRTRYPYWQKKGICKFTKEGRDKIQKNLQPNMKILHALMRQKIPKASIEYMDNRLSVWAAQRGKCAVTGEVLELDEIHCHHKIPKSLSGSDEYRNLVIVHKDIHVLIHATTEETIYAYLNIVNLTKEMFEKLNNLRQQVKNSKI